MEAQAYDLSGCIGMRIEDVTEYGLRGLGRGSAYVVSSRALRGVTVEG